jgi:hypothetical protein
MPDRYFVKNGKPYDMGTPMTPEMLDGAIYRGYRSVRDNNAAVAGGGELAPLLQKAATLNEQTVGPELEQMLRIREQLKMAPFIADVLRNRGMK